MNDYQRIASVIAYLDANHATQPSLRKIAEEAGISPHHFHRLFSKWVGITPKNFVQFLTFRAARKQLLDGTSVLDAALESGLSGPSRLHDLCVRIEAASPGEIKDGGLGVTIHYGIAPSPLGDCLIAESDRGICHLSFHDQITSKQAGKILQTEWPNASRSLSNSKAADLASMIFIPKSKDISIRAWVRGSDFQIRVWRALVEIPFGSCKSYGQLAKDIKAPAAARAVGTAIGANSLAYIIPCHRVIRETGVIGNYRWGSTRKRALLAWEHSVCSELKTS
ncbi:MAG: methylated-DNA--[protein]-cysteine S-methyltransferase [Verrucomicrobiota bacterium]